jgi:SAM-dependent methyltransferase
MPEIRRLSKPLPVDFPHDWYEIAYATHFWFEWRLAAFLRLCDDLQIDRTAPWRGLDIGCGNGVVRTQIEGNSKWTLDGADLNEKHLEESSSVRGDSLYYDIHDRVPELQARYDFIILFDVLEHIDESSKFLDSTLFHLKPGGWLFINVPALETLRSNYDRAAGHVRRYDKKMMQRELAAHPVQARDMRYWGFSMLPLLLARTIATAGRRSIKDIIDTGFKPPSEGINRLLKGVMRLETKLTRRPPLGTSLMAAAVKS